VFGGPTGGQLLPSGDLPVFNPGPNTAQTGFAVKIVMENKDQGLFPIGAQGAAAIYTSNGALPLCPHRHSNLLMVNFCNQCHPDDERFSTFSVADAAVDQRRHFGRVSRGGLPGWLLACSSRRNIPVCGEELPGAQPFLRLGVLTQLRRKRSPTIG